MGAEGKQMDGGYIRLKAKGLIQISQLLQTIKDIHSKENIATILVPDAENIQIKKQPYITIFLKLVNVGNWKVCRDLVHESENFGLKFQAIGPSSNLTQIRENFDKAMEMLNST